MHLPREGDTCLLPGFCRRGRSEHSAVNCHGRCGQLYGLDSPLDDRTTPQNGAETRPARFHSHPMKQAGPTVSASRTIGSAGYVRILLTSMSGGVFLLVWLHATSASRWAVPHVGRRHGVPVQDVALLEVDVPRTWLRRTKRGLWTCDRDTPAERIVFPRLTASA